MNYWRILLNGFFNESSKPYLSSYLFREWKKAEKEHFTKEEFLNGLILQKEKLEKIINREKYDELSYLNKAFASTVRLEWTENEGVTKEIFEEEKKAKIKDIRKCMDTVRNTIYTGKICVNSEFDFKDITLEDLSIISNAIVEFRGLLYECDLDRKEQNKKPIQTYSWTGKVENREQELNEFREKLISKKYISEISQSDFDIIFSGNPQKEIKTPIVWLSSNKSELVYFVIQLKETGIIENDAMKYANRLLKCFKLLDGKELINLANTKKDLDIDLSDTKKNKINNFLKQFI